MDNVQKHNTCKDGPVTTPGTGFHFRHFLRLAGLRCRYSNPPPHGELSLSLSLVLRPTVSRPIYFGIKHPSGAYVQIFIIVWQLRVFWFGAPYLTRGRVCRLQLQLVLASAVIFGSESRRTRGRNYQGSKFQYLSCKVVTPRAGWICWDADVVG
jgi:hypothetical protein